MGTRGGATTLIWPVAIIALGFLTFPPLRSQPSLYPEAMDESLVRYLVGCLRKGPFWGFRDFENQEEVMEASLCHDSLRLLSHDYQSSGRIGREFIESIRIIHDNNQTDVDIYICRFDHRRCPDRTRALNQFLTSRGMKDELRL
ncbi:hypothetical protein OROHE_015819 [Orobanche hederae]